MCLNASIGPLRFNRIPGKATRCLNRGSFTSQPFWGGGRWNFSAVHLENKTPVLGYAVPVLGVKPKRE